MPDQKNIRAFLAIEPPASVRQEFDRIQNRLKKDVQGTIRWTSPAGIHLTLKFFGDIAESDVESVSTVVREEIKDIEPLRLDIKSLGVFPDLRRARVIWLGTLGDTERLSVLQKNLDRGFGKLGFAEDDRPFRAHWTLARIKSMHGLSGMAHAVEYGRDIEAGSFMAKELVLFRSELKPQGAIYSKLAVYALEG